MTIDRTVTSIVLPWPPGANRKSAGHQRERRSRAEVWREKARSWVGLQDVGRIDGPVTAELVLLPPDDRARDLAELASAVFDVLAEAGVIRAPHRVHRVRSRAADAPPKRPGVLIVHLEAQAAP